MDSLEKDNSLFKEYLKILNVSIKKPSIDALRELIKSHLMYIPFENISKLFPARILAN